uniref:Succinylglutamate desuccinylase/Aspartoacylase catalytic domain-containing protein n=1 Tax=Globisporangium ultimum (strain ATCC 200006 / CBS 805.95 / DAOM BR144) TaxID=431595 RepID=K3WU78_GLOUD
MARAYNSFAQLQNGVYRFIAGGKRVNDAADAGARHVTIVGGVHGNERIGVAVLDALRLALLHVSPLRTSGGATVFPTLTPQSSVTLVYGNPAAIRVGKRGSTPHADLNRCFSADMLSPSSPPTSYEQRRAQELAPIFAASDVMLDLHSTNKPSEPFVRIAGNRVIPSHIAHMVAKLPCDIVLHDPNYLLADGTVALTDEYVGAQGGVGICYESGLASDLSEAKINSIIGGILQILEDDTKSIEPLATTANNSKNETRAATAMTKYEITQVFKLTENGFRWADGVGDTNFQRIPVHQPIGFIGRGRDETPFTVDYDAHIVFPKIASLWKLG